jgi:leucyl-tRNA---protein transferase
MEDCTASNYPANPPPIDVELAQMTPHPCPYLPNREARLRAFYAPRIDPNLYHEFLDASFRRSGSVIYQPVCRGCRACMSLRVPVQSFRASKSQRRCRRRNADLTVAIGPLGKSSDEKYDLYLRYQAERHKASEPDSRTTFESFLYRSPVDTVEFTYRNPGGKLLAVGICDVCDRSLSSVYFYFDPDESSRGLGNFGALYEIDFAARRGIAYYYLGYWVQGCLKMEYKAQYRPCQALYPDGHWRELNHWTNDAEKR